MTARSALPALAAAVVAPTFSNSKLWTAFSAVCPRSEMKRIVMGKNVEWVKRWRMTVSKEPVLPGVYRRQEGGFVVRGSVTDPRRVNPKTGKARLREILFTLPTETDAKRALVALEEEKSRVRDGDASTEIPTFKRYSRTLFEHKVAVSKIATPSGKEKWIQALTNHLWPAFGDFFIDKLRYSDIQKWQTEVSIKMREGVEVHRTYQLKNGTEKTTTKMVHYSPETANGWLRILRVITATMTVDFDLPRDPCVGIPEFDTASHRTYTHEEPNSLTVDEVSAFLAKMRELYPQHYAITLLAFVIGQRPSTLRPLRRSGSSPDFLVNEGVLLIRRSSTFGQVAVDRTKTKLDQRLALPRDVCAVLKWHVETQLTTLEQRRSELLFPSNDGRFRSTSSLQDPFRRVADAIGLKKKITPKAGRRTFQDMSRAAGIEQVVKKAISGHKTDAMVERYSTTGEDEMRVAIGKVVDIATARSKILASDGRP
jgi:integrase